MNWALIDLLRESTPLYVAMEVAHTLGFIVLVGAVFFFDLRILGFARTLPVRALAKLLLPWSWGALLVIVPTGLAMFAVNADVLLDDRAFKYKMGLLLAAGLNAIFFLTGPYQTARQWDVDVRAPAMARLSAAASLLLWTGVITCGRLLAYV